MPNAANHPLRAAIAATRFGLGARPGELQAASRDPVGWLLADLRDTPAEAAPAPSVASRTRLAELRQAQAEQRALRMDQATRQDAAGAAMPSEATGSPRDRLRELRLTVRDDMLARTRRLAGSRKGFRERWVLFWSNVFTVSVQKFPVSIVATAFEQEAIAPNAFGRFADLLVAATSHPAMLIYLDQTRSTGPNSTGGGRLRAGLNENLAREVLELHSVGTDSGYTQEDVTEFARALTGWSIGMERDAPDSQGRFFFRPALHEPGPRRILGRDYPEGGVEQATAVLRDLAAHPATAAHMAKRLATAMIADDPPPGLVAELREAWRRSDGDLMEVATALIRSPLAWDPAPRKFKTPEEFAVSAWRAFDILPTDATRDVANPLNGMGQPPMGAPQPNGWPDRAASWAAPGAIVQRFAWAARFAAATNPSETDPLEIARNALGARLTPALAQAMQRAESRTEALTLFLMSPEFQRR